MGSQVTLEIIGWLYTVTWWVLGCCGQVAATSFVCSEWPSWDRGHVGEGGARVYLSARATQLVPECALVSGMRLLASLNMLLDT